MSAFRKAFVRAKIYASLVKLVLVLVAGQQAIYI